MGDRVLFQVFNKDEVSPVIYGHNAGHEAPAICRAVKARMKGRPGDVQYTAARVVQEAIATYPDGNLSFGIWNSEKLLVADDTHGDAGIVLIDVSGDEMKFKCLGGYLRSDGGIPVMSR